MTDNKVIDLSADICSMSYVDLVEILDAFERKIVMMEYISEEEMNFFINVREEVVKRNG